jgi:hypothetical protein
LVPHKVKEEARRDGEVALPQTACARRVLTMLGPTPTRISSVADDANPVISPYKPTFTWCRMLEDGAHQE